MSEARATLDKAMRESEFQRTVIELAQRNGYLVAHFRPARTATGWRTPVEADGEGFPDLVMAHRTELRPIIFAELKSESGKLTPKQCTWIEALKGSLWDPQPEVIVRVWRPSDWESIERLLRGEQD